MTNLIMLFPFFIGIVISANNMAMDKKENTTTNNEEPPVIVGTARMQMISQMVKEFGKIENKMDEMSQENAVLKEEFGKMKEEINGLKAANYGLKEELNELKNEMANMKEEIVGLKEKLYGKVQIEEMVTKEIDGEKWVNYDRNAYKLNEAESGSNNLTIFEGSNILEHTGPDGHNCVRTVLPIPSFNLTNIKMPTLGFYFEMEILFYRDGSSTIWIGFCDDKQFPLVKVNGLGFEKNSIGIWSKGGIFIGGFLTKFEKFEFVENVDEFFWRQGDFVGLGIIDLPNSKMECFATWNGILLGKVELPPKFSTQLFPTFCTSVNDKIKVNFADHGEWRFKEFGGLL